MPSDAIAAVEAASAQAETAAVDTAEARALDDPTTNPIVQERREAAVRSAEAAQADAEAARHAAEAAASGHLDVVA